MNGKLVPHVLKPLPSEYASVLFGSADSHLRLIESELQVVIITRGESVSVEGSYEQAVQVEKILEKLLLLVKKGITVSEREVAQAIQMSKNETIDEFEQLFKIELIKNFKGKMIHAKTLGQIDYLRAIQQHDITFGIGPAGTGKTYLAVLLAIQALRNGTIQRIILTRPAVEAGESLGFLPGDLKEKVDPYLRPIYDALHDLIGQEHTGRLIERGTIEIAPLAYMRGRTLDDAFVILDEAQNTTHSQMKMFLTRLGFGSKMVITGDITQIDLPKGAASGLVSAVKTLSHVNGIRFVMLQSADVVRHPLVGKIIDAYEKQQNEPST